jgi:hypothetical protein
MQKELRTEILINATPEKVWSVLTDFENYKNWNPFIKSIKGKVEAGKIIEARIEPPDGQAMTFKPKILVFEKNKELRWLGHFIFKGLFDGEHIFELIDNGNQTTTFIQREIFNGILVSLFKKMLDTNTVNGFNLMNQKLKEESEKN